MAPRQSTSPTVMSTKHYQQSVFCLDDPYVPWLSRPPRVTCWPYLLVQVALVSYVPRGFICHSDRVGSKARKLLTGQVNKHDNPHYVCTATSPAAKP